MKLYEHQKEALKLTIDQNHVAYYHDMGLGKTFTGSEKMIELGARINLIICQKSKIDDWIDHFKINYLWIDDVLDLTNKKHFDLFINLIKLNPKVIPPNYYCIGVINYDLVWRRKELLQLENFTLMLDESSLIQNEQAKRSKFIMKLKPKNVILLSGTPTGGKYERLWSQLHLLGWNISKEMYYNHYVDYEWDDSEGFPRMVINGYKNEKRLKRKMREHGCHFLKTDEVFDLPEQIQQTIKINTSNEYKTFKQDSIITINDHELIGDTILTKMLYERQLCGEFNEDKLAAFNDLLESTNDRLIVFYNFNAELETLKYISEALGRVSSIVNGKHKDLYAYDNINDSVTFLQYQAGAMGLNLQKANKIIYFTPPVSSELFEQSKKRIHRIGQTKPCFYYYLICRNSIEEKIYKTLKMRKDFTEALFNEN